MTPEHIQRLISGYATGTLSAAQRELLFEAALDDQELFDELARDQALKELLEAPGVRQRLIESIAEVRPQDHWWLHPLPWALGGSALAISAGLMALVFLTPSGSKPVPSNPTEVAENRPPVTAEAPALPAETKSVTPGGKPGQPAPKLQNEPKPAAPASPETPTGAAAPAPPNLQNEPKTIGQLGAAPPAAGRNGTGADTAVSEQLKAATPLPRPPSAAAPPPAIRALAARGALPPGRFYFDYSIHDGVLRIVPGSDGYLLVRATVGPIDRLVLSTAHVVRSTPAELRVPDGANAMVVLFSTRPVLEDTTDDLADRAPRRTGPSGTVEDPRPTVNSRLEVRIDLQ